MSETNERYQVTWMLGTVEIGRPTGRFVTRENGFQYQVYTDTIRRDQFGAIISRTPTEGVVGIRLD